MSDVKLFLGDCFDIFKEIKDNSVDLILCDLPYGSTKCKWDVILPFDLMWFEYKRIIKEDGAIVLFGKEPFSSQLRMSNLEMYKYDWIECEKLQGLPVGYTSGVPKTERGKMLGNGWCVPTVEYI